MIMHPDCLHSLARSHLADLRRGSEHNALRPTPTGQRGDPEAAPRSRASNWLWRHVGLGL